MALKELLEEISVVFCVLGGETAILSSNM